MRFSLGGWTLVAVSLSISLLGSSVLMAQTTDATVTGQITDQAGRSVPHASVILTNLALPTLACFGAILVRARGRARSVWTLLRCDLPAVLC